MNGLEMLTQLRENPELKDTPVIMLTAVCEPRDISAAGSLGIVDYITKPFDFTDLTEKITQILDKKLISPIPTIKSCPKRHLKALLSVNGKIWKQYLTLFLLVFCLLTRI
jgi:DNA-binding response OmpR family regulator